MPTSFICAYRHEATMDSVHEQVEKLMRLNPDTELRFDDGTLPANSNVLSFFSSVLRGAIEAESAHGDRSGSSSTNMVIPMQGLTKAQWLAAAPFWVPVRPAPTVQTWEEAELLLTIGSRFDLWSPLDKASEFLTANADTLTARITNSKSVGGLTEWEWLRLADKLHLTSCLPALLSLVAEKDRRGAIDKANTDGLSAATLQDLVAVLITQDPQPWFFLFD
jgi:hypothetical protein